MVVRSQCFFNDTATTEIYTLSLHDALPISVLRASRKERRLAASPSSRSSVQARKGFLNQAANGKVKPIFRRAVTRSEEHTSELQSRQYLVCRLLLVDHPGTWRRRARNLRRQ